MSSPIVIYKNQSSGDFILKFIVYKNKDDKPQRHQKKLFFVTLKLSCVILKHS